MKVACLQDKLARALAITSQAASRSHGHITQNALLTAERQGITAYATDLEVSASIFVPAQVIEEGAAALPARLIAELAAAMPPERADIQSTDAPVGVSLKCGRQRANISGANAADYPQPIDIDDSRAWRIEPERLRKAINHTLFASAADKARPALCAVNIDMRQDSAEFAATDSFRLSKFITPLTEPALDEAQILINTRALEIITRLLSAETNPVRIALSEDKKRALIRLDSADITTLQPDAAFPKYASLIPTSSATTITVNAASLRNAARSARLFEPAMAGAIRLQTQPGLNGERRLGIAAANEDAGYHQSDIDAVVEGPDAKIAIYSKYLIEALEPLGTEPVTLYLDTPTQPALLRSDDAQSYEHVIMPVFVQWH